jgi:4'-phosphopantetheinyl transferase EntD
LHGLSTPGLTGKILFSATESVYKCQYPITNKFLGFHAVEVELDEGEFRAVFQQEAGEFQPGDVMSGRYLVEEGLVATACELPR